MCGIVGIRRFDGAPVDGELLRAMSRQLSHRGPDEEGCLIRGPVGLGHTRLSIIDPEGSSQPMSRADGALHVCFNGEILNYRELRSEMPYPYVTGGDTEVLLASFDRYGPGSVERLIGQFAYAVYSEREDELWLFRDRLGILPLYYYGDSEVFLFASEVKALLPALPRTPDVDPASLSDYLERRSVPAPWTLFSGIRKLPPGCVLRVGRASQLEDPSPYWTLPAATPAPVRSRAEVVAELDDLLCRAVRRNLVADVPVGAYLSGGIDSSAIVGVMRRIAPEQEILTFAASFGDQRFDESRYARMMAAASRTTHHEVAVSADDFQSLWPLLTWHRDAPVSEASDVAVYELARLAARHVKVVLSGEGSDELFAGYPKHRFATIAARASMFPAVLRSPFLTSVERLLPMRAARLRILVRALAETGGEEQRLNAWFAPFTSRERRSLLGRAPDRRTAVLAADHGDPLRRMLVEDVRGWLTDNLLERGDRMSMAASLELRPPFLDSDLVEWALALPSSHKLDHRLGKSVLREVSRRYVPLEIVERPKVGFRVPLDVWFRNGLRDLAFDALLGPQSFVGSIFDRRTISDLLSRHMRERADESLRLWTLLSLEIWHDTFFGTAAKQTVAAARAGVAA